MRKNQYLSVVMVSIGMLACAGILSACNKNTEQQGALQESDVQTDTDNQNNVEHTVSTEGQTGEQSDDMDANVADALQSGSCYIWQDITLTIPEDWQDRYLVFEDEDSVDFYQKASYEAYEGMGFLFGICKTDEWMNYGAGETMIAYTDNGIMYYLIQPTDVPADADDEESLNEYICMAEQAVWIADTMQIDAQGIHYDSEQYQIPLSSIQLVDAEALINFTDNQLWIARNEIYARHGRTFKNEYLQGYFDSCSWYTPIEGKSEVADSELSEVEKKNLETIVAAESVYDEQNPYPKEYALGDTVKENLLGDNVTNTIIYNVTEQGDEFGYELNIDGEKYDLSDYIYMESPVTEAFYITNLSVMPSATSMDEDGLEIAVLDYGPSEDPVTHFFKYNGGLTYIGAMYGFPFADMNSGVNGFTNYSGVYGTVRSDLIETAYLQGYWWYDSTAWRLDYTDTGWYNYKYFRPHELLVDLPVYTQMDSSSRTITIPAQVKVYFLQSDLEEWIYLRGKDGTEGYIQVKDGTIENVGLPADSVFSDLYFFD